MTDGVPPVPGGNFADCGAITCVAAFTHATGAACRCSNSALPALGAAPVGGALKLHPFVRWP